MYYTFSKRVSSFFLGLFIAAFVGTGIYFMILESIKSYEIHNSGTAVMGKVLKKYTYTRDDNRYYTIRFTYPHTIQNETKLLTTEKNISSSWYEKLDIGEEIKVKYDNKNPKDARLVNSAKNYYYLPIIAFFSSFFVFYGLYRIVMAFWPG